ncbi:hypothetical protein CY35_10G050700 [Sphagnum magellanicum]|nr:hypothetical protein CY35_10G050700 [Sphagnum magellanicum]
MLVSFPKVIVPCAIGSCAIAYVCSYFISVRKIFGGTVPHTMQGGEWAKETSKRMNAWPREAAGPVVMNPISRQNYHKI